MWKRQSTSPSQLKKAPTAAPAVSRWHAVSVVGRGNCCNAARDMIERRFLSREAPRLPLAECTEFADCHCSYQHHGDRRGQPRRRQEMGVWPEPFSGDERRCERGRRATDVSAINDWKG
jgi:hypothetical protein